MSAAIGIDLGTTNTVVAHVHGEQARALADEAGERLIPSVVSFHPSGQVLVGRPARERRLVDARSTVYSIKRLIGRAWDGEDVQRARKRFPFELREGPGQGALVVARGETYTLPEISAYVLRRARTVAEHALGEPATRAVITVPANFNDLQRAATKVAGRVAGLDVLRILNEPTAAALAYGYGRGGSERVAVFDLGGGTFDVTFLDLTNNVFEVVATAGDSFLGGDDLDYAIAERMADAFLRQHRYDARSDPQAFERLRIAAEIIKVRLSTQPTAFVDLNDVAFGPGGKALGLGFAMSRNELNTLLDPLLDRAFRVCEQAITPARLDLSSFQSVLLVGGSTRIPRLRERVASFFGREPRVSVSPDEVVALGAAIQAMALTSEARRFDDDAPTSARAKPSGPSSARAVGSPLPGRPPPSSGSPSGDLRSTPRTPRYTLAGIGIGASERTAPAPAASMPHDLINDPDAWSDEETVARARQEPSPTSTAQPTAFTAPPRSAPAARTTAPLAVPYAPSLPPGPSAASSTRDDLEVLLPVEDSVARMFPHPPSSPGLVRATPAKPSAAEPRPSAPPLAPPSAPPSAPPPADPSRTDNALFGVRDERPTTPEPSIMDRLAGASSIPPDRESGPSFAQARMRPDGTTATVSRTPPESPNAFQSQTTARASGRAPQPSAPAASPPALAPLPSFGPGQTAPFPLVGHEQGAPSSQQPDVDPYSVPAARAASSTSRLPIEAPLLLDVTPHSLCVETVGGYCDIVVGRNTRVPCEQTRVFATVQDGQSAVRLRVAQGESARFAENTPLGELDLSGIRRAPRGEVVISVTFAIDANALLQVRARDTATGQQANAALRLIGTVAEQDPEAMRARQEAQKLVY